MSSMFWQPGLPRGLLRDLVELRAGDAVYDPNNGGQWSDGPVERETFQGCILPVSEKDWRNAAQGTYTKDSRKLYTNGHELRVGGQVYDPLEKAVYTVTGDLDHGPIHPLRRFVVERKGKAAAK